MKLTGEQQTTCYITFWNGLKYISYDLGEKSKGFADIEMTSDMTITYAFGACLLEHTPVTLADGTKKMIEDVTYDDVLLTYDFDEGKRSA